MDYCPNTVQYFSPNWAEVAPYKPKRPELKTLVQPTPFSTIKSDLVDFFATGTGLRTPTPEPSSQATLVPVPTPMGNENTATPATNVIADPHSGDVERIAKQRVKLMAAKYVGGAESSEIVARLEILNRRLLEHAPRVSKEQVAALEKANDQLERIRASRAERSRRLGISA